MFKIFVLLAPYVCFHIFVKDRVSVPGGGGGGGGVKIQVKHR